MSILRVEKNANYVVMNRTALNDERLSWKAKGIMAYMLSMPDDWTFYINELTKHSVDGEKAFRSGLKELKENGYVKRKPVRDGNKIIGWETIVVEVPQTLDNTLLADFVHVENVQVQNVDVQKGALLSTEKELNTDKTKYIQFADTVRLTQEQYDRLVEEYGKKTVDDYIERLDEWQTNNPRKKKKDHNKTLRVWMKDVKKVDKPKEVSGGALAGFWGADEY